MASFDITVIIVEAVIGATLVLIAFEWQRFRTSQILHPEVDVPAEFAHDLAFERWRYEHAPRVKGVERFAVQLLAAVVMSGLLYWAAHDRLVLFGSRYKSLPLQSMCLGRLCTGDL